MNSLIVSKIDLLTEQCAGLRIRNLVADSRLVQVGDTFVAYPGEHRDGRLYIAAALAQGANAVIYEAENFVWSAAADVPHLAVENLREQVGDLANHVYGQPTQHMWVVGVTGTNGKTSTSHWIAQALSEVGKKCALIGTLGNGFADALQATGNTTPEAIQVHKLCADFLQHDAQAVAMEVSSHALDQGRVNGVHFDVALLTNLSRDHLDYHGDMASYAASKRKFFDVQSLRYAVLNLDDATGAVWAEELTQRNSSASLHAHSPLSNFPPQAGERANDPLRGNSTPEVVAYGLTDAAVQHARSLGLRMVHGNLLANSANGLQLAVQSDWGTARLESQLLGRFNAENLLGVLAVLLLSGVTLPEAIACLAKVTAVAGRMQRLGEKHTPTVIVDYAHTPDALEKVLQTLREVMAQSGGKLCCVFGCGGNRDNGKRPMMGKVAEQFADQIIVTSDNPRDELPTEIAAQIVQGMTEKKHRVMLDRADAINYAIAHAQACDTVLIAGKGHEEYQEIHGAKYPFSDVKIAKIALQNWPLEVRV